MDPKLEFFWQVAVVGFAAVISLFTVRLVLYLVMFLLLELRYGG